MRDFQRFRSVFFFIVNGRKNATSTPTTVFFFVVVAVLVPSFFFNFIAFLIKPYERRSPPFLPRHVTIFFKTHFSFCFTEFYRVLWPADGEGVGAIALFRSRE